MGNRRFECGGSNPSALKALYSKFWWFLQPLLEKIGPILMFWVKMMGFEGRLAYVIIYTVCAPWVRIGNWSGFLNGIIEGCRNRYQNKANRGVGNQNRVIQPWKN